MSHHSDDNMLIATSDSFWEPGNYKRTTKRIEDGHKLCDSLIALVQERAEIEKSYAKALKNWSKNWNDKIEKGPEYGTTEAAWKGVLVESERLCDLHLRVKENLCNDIIHQVKTWQKETYHKSMMTLKERKEMEDAFKKAQKPWAKLLQKVEKAKSEYHNSCKTERTAANMERNASADSSLSPDQMARGSENVKKMQDRVQKTKEEVQKAKEKYEAALQEINQYNPKYMEDMTQVFEKCQEMEAQRLQFFKDVLFGIHKCLNISQDPILPQIYEEFYHTVNNADHEKDLKWWSNNHGVNMAMNWPQFEDYTEEFRDITKGSKSKEALPAGSITLINQRPVGEDVHEYPPVNNKSKSKPSSRVISTDGGHGDSKTDTMNSSKHSSEKNNHDGNAVNRTSTMTNGTNVKQESNPFEEEEWDEDSGEPLVDNGEPGVLVRALYDYEGAEADELSFKQGDVFDKLEDEDEQGWCKGRKDGRVGLYPANYVELVSP
ncbi:protein kinase C and casein kinase substrate in neurons protein 2 isoform X1 [Bombus vosnesenskii]|uniref:Protein kinase C and casein kinase substrate in neurons protein 2 isoform X1 n=4 Tax=Bombus TaxID=28641 RepID=A0A6J3K7K3_9HYME|nr:protein kinase C and casein kinase substrate in neurons protein 2 isoform X1 [Bombus terrestris]XP_012168957.1 protein kinase C and casein kinase substrate in neurons protein 2 isoform X1 [Bombus terrestris]XP_012237497.1 protein kinase C and casein kinase substrate in neurons protein 2 isoform X1 [Bombus impatiens]XP_012237498.1 protein kinase C and casein kinase substrate in neurons protein 2 isoform X1 [Bombus impatiens]XP_033189852.1 protein kinase C and casein kinase substrate in neuron